MKAEHQLSVFDTFYRMDKAIEQINNKIKYTDHDNESELNNLIAHIKNLAQGIEKIHRTCLIKKGIQRQKNATNFSLNKY